jgi:integrase
MSPIWTGCVYDPERRHWRHLPGLDVERDEFWWLPVLAILHGGRMEEYCLMTGDDVVDIDRIPVMDITKGLKTGSSERVVPVHQTAIECGFLDLAAKVGSGRLFPLMTPGGPFQKYSWIYSERYTDYRRRIGVYRPLMDYHSHRTSAATRIVNAAGSNGKAILLADEITGHDSRARQDQKDLQSVTLDYLAGSELTARRDAVNSITF